MAKVIFRGVYTDTDMEEIAAIIYRAQMGDSEAYSVLVSRFQDMAYGYAYAILNDFHLAQDAAQEAFIEAYQCLPTLREAFAFPAWLKRIVYKHCDRLTRSKRLATAPLEAVAEMASPLPGPSEVAERHELAKRVQDAIGELPEEQRVVTTLFYISGYSYQEIADFLEVPANTVKSRLHASRSRLRERMVDMVQDEFKANALPADFTQETVEQAVAQGKALNENRQFDQAEQLMRLVLEQVPQHPGALEELNHAMMNGRVYSQHRWDLLPELAKQGKIILQTIDDEDIHRKLAHTLLAIPAMPEAVAFLEDWIARKGPNMERLGMLAWAKGCMADYAAAEASWQDILTLAGRTEPDEILQHIPFIAYTLVDCFSEAGEVPRAGRVAQEAWKLCRDLRKVPFQVRSGNDTDWMMLFFLARLDLNEIAQFLMLRYRDDADPEAQATLLCIRNWIDDPKVVVADWLDWVRERIKAGEWSALKKFRFGSMTLGLRARGELDHNIWNAAIQLDQAIWELLGEANTKDAEEERPFWNCQRFDAMGAILAKDWAAAAELARCYIEECGVQKGAYLAIQAAAGQGVTTPPDLVRVVEENGIASVDEYGMFGWYMVAREAAAAGDEANAFDALRKALFYWSNPPYAPTKIWENDLYWGDLRDHPEFKGAFDEKRRRIGPICGMLHYFPMW